MTPGVRSSESANHWDHCISWFKVGNQTVLLCTYSIADYTLRYDFSTPTPSAALGRDDVYGESSRFPPLCDRGLIHVKLAASRLRPAGPTPRKTGKRWFQS